MGIECDLPQSESRRIFDLDTGLLKRDRMLVQRTPMAELCIGFGSRGELLKRLAAAEALLKDFNPDQARDDHGLGRARVVRVEIAQCL